MSLCIYIYIHVHTGHCKKPTNWRPVCPGVLETSESHIQYASNWDQFKNFGSTVGGMAANLGLSKWTIHKLHDGLHQKFQDVFTLTKLHRIQVITDHTWATNKKLVSSLSFSCEEMRFSNSLETTEDDNLSGRFRIPVTSLVFSTAPTAPWAEWRLRELQSFHWSKTSNGERVGNATHSIDLRRIAVTFTIYNHQEWHDTIVPFNV